MPEVEWEKVADNLVFPEGPAWDGGDSIFWSNCHGGFISKYGPDGVSVFLRAQADPFTFGKSNGMTFGADGHLYACDFERKAIIRIAMDGTTSVYTELTGDKKLNGPNDLAFDPHGNLYFSDPGAYSKTNRDGGVYRVDAKSKELVRVKDDLGFPNGLAFSADAKTLYLAESAFERVLKMDVHADGSLGAPNVFAEMPGGDPDGMNFDEAGNLYVAHFGGGHLLVYAPDGSLVRKIKVPGKKPSNVEFAGTDRRTLFVTEDETNCVYRTRVEIPGLPLFHAPTQYRK